MKKIFSALLAGALLAFSSVGVYAADDATIKIEGAKYNATTEKVTVTGKVDGASDSQSITVMSTGIKSNTGNDLFDMDTIVHIDQQDNVVIGADGSFSLDFYLSDSAVKGTSYYVRVGGTGISSPAYMAFVFGSGSSQDDPKIVYGDVDKNGTVDVNDAVILLDYVLNPSAKDADGNPVITEDGFKNAQVYKEVLTPEKFTAAEASMILQKALDSDYSFPVEK